MSSHTSNSALSIGRRLLRLPLRLIPKAAIFRVQQGPLKGLKWIVGAHVNSCWLGTYEADKQVIMQQVLKPGQVVYDIGANAGFYTLLFSRAVGPQGRVVAFEPLPENGANLLKHVQINDLKNVTVVAAAVADTADVASFRIAPHNAMGSLSPVTTPFGVPTLKLDDLIIGGYPAPDVVKIDVEGAEGLVLRGAMQLLARGRTTWFIALHGESACIECIEILVAAGYALFQLDGQPIEPSSPQLVDELYAVPQNADGEA